MKKKSPSNPFMAEANYPGVRKRSLGYKEGYGEDFSFYIQYRDKSQNNKVVNKQLGKASDGWTAKMAFDEKERRVLGNEVLCLEDKPKERITLHDVWLDYCDYNKEKIRAIKEYKSYIKNHLGDRDFFRSTPICKITNRAIQDFRKALESSIDKKGNTKNILKPQTVRHILKVVKLLLNFGVKRELCDPRHDLIIEMPHVDNQVTEYMTEEQLDAYKKALEEDHDIEGVVYLKIALYTGMRPKAILNLKWTDLDYEKNQIMLRGESAKNKKTSYIPFPNAVKEALEYIEKSDSEYIFAQKRTLKARTTFAKTARRVRDRAGLPDKFRPIYMLRHNFATYLASSGQVDIYTIQKLLTHNSPQMTQRYAHLMDEALQKGSKVIEDIFK